MDSVKSLAEYAEDIMAALGSLCDGKATLAAIQDVEREELDALYAVGYRLLAAGKAEDAQHVFRLLCTLDHLTGKHWLALAAAEQARHHREGAQVALAAAEYLEHRKREEVTQ